jgi:hypothetical protein
MVTCINFCFIIFSTMFIYYIAVVHTQWRIQGGRGSVPLPLDLKLQDLESNISIPINYNYKGILIIGNS